MPSPGGRDTKAVHFKRFSCRALRDLFCYIYSQGSLSLTLGLHMPALRALNHALSLSSFTCVLNVLIVLAQLDNYMISTIAVSLFFLILILVGASIIYWTIRNGISPMPTTSKVAAKLLSSTPENIDGVVYELGAGWGTLAFPLAKKYPINPVKAYENSPIPYLYCRLRLMLFPQANLTFYRSDFFDLHLNDASLIVCYLYPGAMQKLKAKFDNELHPGALLLSNTFSIPGLKPINTIDTADCYHSQIFVYKKT